VVGYTISPDFLGSGNKFGSIFIAKLNADGSSLAFSVTKRSPSAGAGHGVALDAANDIYFTGAINAPADIYIARITEGGTSGAFNEGGGFSRLHLEPNTPNGFTRTTRVGYSIPTMGGTPVVLAIYDILGRLVRTLINTPQPAGTHSVSWDVMNASGAPVFAGVYFYDLRWSGEKRTGRMLLVR
jgi:hypothetical protein